MDKPNIIYIQSDQHTFDIMSCAGDDVVETPNLDKLANSGTLITNSHNVTDCSDVIISIPNVA